jgi:hypothetical protein
METITKFKSVRNIISVTFFFASFFLINCTGPEGPMGPTGEKGDPGYDGANGKDGTSGQDGAPGSTFVKSIQFEVLATDWKGDTNGYTAILTVPEITSAIYDHGAVLVYMLNEQDPNNKYFNMLPYTYVNNSSTEYMDFDAYVGQIDLKLKWTDNGLNSTLAPTLTEYFKIIVAEGTPLSILKKNVNIANYEAVAKYLKFNEKSVILK